MIFGQLTGDMEQLHEGSKDLIDGSKGFERGRERIIEIGRYELNLQVKRGNL